MSAITQELLQRKLRAKGVSAKATVLATDCKTRMGSVHSDGRAPVLKWALRMQVRPPDGAEFDVEFEQSLTDISPLVGQELDVLFDATDHSKILIDTRVDAPNVAYEKAFESGDTSAEAAAMARMMPGRYEGPDAQATLAARLAAPAPTFSPADIAARIAQAQALNSLQATGIVAPGVLNALHPAGPVALGGGQPTQVDVTISPPGAAEFATSFTQTFLPSQLLGLTAGTAVQVRYDPANPSVAILVKW